MAILMSAVFAIAILCAATITKVGGHLVDSQRAQHAANAAVLAAIYDEQVADNVASENGGGIMSLEDHRDVDGTVTVRVRVGSMVRNAKAFDTWRDTSPTLEP